MIKFKYLLIACAFLSITFSSCRDCVQGSGVLLSENRTSQVSDFTELEANSDFDVYITIDSITQVLVEGDDNIVPYIKTYLKGDRLVLENRSSKCFKYDQRMEVHVRTPYVDKVVLNGSGNIYCDNWGFTNSLLSLVNAGSGKLSFSNIITDDFKAELMGSGNIALSGSSDYADYSLSGSGSIKGINFNVDECYINTSGSGNVYVYFNDKLTIDLYGSGSVYFNGNVNKVFVNNRGSGIVRED